MEEEGKNEKNGKNGSYGTYGTYGLKTGLYFHTSHRSHSSLSPKKALLAVIREALAQGQAISLPGLGSFCVVLRAARAGRNPRTGEPVAIEARRRVHFKAGKGLRLLLNP